MYTKIAMKLVDDDQVGRVDVSPSVFPRNFAIDKYLTPAVSFGARWLNLNPLSRRRFVSDDTK